MCYDYFSAVREALEAYREANPGSDIDDAMGADEVTGNSSGSYTFSCSQAAEYVGENLDLLADALETFGGEYPRDPETADVLIRCYVLSILC